jgi:CBS domain-containing protein
MPYRLVSEVIADQKCLTVSARTSVRQAAQLMKAHHVSALMVVGATRVLIGICTERDLVFDVLAGGLDPDQTSVSVVMTANPLSIAPDKPFGHALHMMYEGGFRHVPVVDGSGQPIGMLSARDVLDSEAFSFDADLNRREAIAVAL